MITRIIQTLVISIAAGVLVCLSVAIKETSLTLKGLI